MGWALQAIEEDARIKCTGVSARWCPIHGDCTCTTHDGDGSYWAMSDDDCPLHSITSTHAEPLWTAD